MEGEGRGKEGKKGAYMRTSALIIMHSAMDININISRGERVICGGGDWRGRPLQKYRFSCEDLTYGTYGYDISSQEPAL